MAVRSVVLSNEGSRLREHSGQRSGAVGLQPCQLHRLGADLGGAAPVRAVCDLLRLDKKILPPAFAALGTGNSDRCLVRTQGHSEIAGAGGEALNEGSLVCIFAEGRFTRTGFMLPFHRGLEQIVKNTNAPIIPVCLNELWGSIFSFYGDRTLWKWPRMLPYRVSVAFGKPMLPTSTAAEVREAVQKLSADCAIARSDQCRPVPAEFVHAAARRPFRPCVIDATDPSKQPLTLSYSTVLARAICLARQLKSRLDNSLLVGIWLPPGIDAVTAHLAAAFCGKAVVHLDHSSADAARSVIDGCQLKQVLTTEHFLRRESLPDLPSVELIDTAGLLATLSFGQRFLAHAAAVTLPGFVIERWLLGLHHHGLDDLAAVVFTRGTTGKAKGVMLTHRNLAASVSSLAKTVDPLPRDRLLGVLPLSQSTGYVCTLWAPLAIGASVVYAKTSLLPSVGEGRGEGESKPTVGLLCKTQHCTVLLATPEILQQAIDHCQTDDFHSLHTVVCIGSKLPPNLLVDFETAFGIRPLEAYACTELTSIAATNVRGKTLEGFTQVGSKPGSVGQPLPGTACRIVNPETWATLPAGQEGLLQFCGPNLMRGYWHNDERSQAVMRDGWFSTGDRALIDEDGFVTITTPNPPR